MNATVIGANTDRLLHSTDPVERTVEMLRIDRGFARWTELQEAQANLIANEVCRRFGGR